MNVTGNALALEAVVALEDVASIQAAIRENYGFQVSEQYAADLIAFVDAMTNPSVEEPETHEPVE
jgi:deferrochelatase/peroxidase EfeB